MSKQITNLGEIVARIQAAIDGAFNDPISQATGYYGDPKAAAERIAAEFGTTLDEVAAQVDARVDAKTAYLLGIGALAAEDTL